MAQFNEQKEVILPLDTTPRFTQASTICEKAAGLVAGDRQKTHGDKVKNHQNIADLWSAYLLLVARRSGIVLPDHLLTAADASVMMVLLKAARTTEGAFNLDDFVDMCGYAGCAGEIAMRTQG